MREVAAVPLRERIPGDDLSVDRHRRNPVRHALLRIGEKHCEHRPELLEGRAMWFRCRVEILVDRHGVTIPLGDP